MDSRLNSDTTHKWVDSPDVIYSNDNDYLGAIHNGVFVSAAYYICSECGLRKKVKWIAYPDVYMLPWEGVYRTLDTDVEITCGEVLMKAVLE